MFIRSPKSVYRHLFDLLIRFLVEIIIYYQSVIIRFIEKNGSSSRKVIFHSLKRNCKIQFGVSSFFFKFRIDFHNPQTGKPANLQNSAVLRLLEEQENRRGGHPGKSFHFFFE